MYSLIIICNKKIKSAPGQVTQLIVALSHITKRCGFYSLSGHISQAILKIIFFGNEDIWLQY